MHFKNARSPFGNFRKAEAAGGVAPSLVVAPVASVPFAIAGQTLSCTEGTWVGTEPITKTFQLESSANGVSGWSNVGGATSNSYLISTGAAQLLFYRFAVTGSNGVGSVTVYSNVVGGVDIQAESHFNRVTANIGVMTYGLVGVDTRVKQIKFIYNITDITTINTDGKWLDWFGYKPGSGNGLTAGRALNKVYSILGANYDYVQSSLTAQKALGAWTPGENYLATFAGAGNNANSTAKANPNNSKITIVLRFRKVTSNFNALLTHRSGATLNWSLNWGNAALGLTLADGSNAFASATLPSSFNFDGWVRLIVTTSGSDLIGQYATSTDGTNWTNLGTAITATGKAGQIGSSSQPFCIAEWGSRTGIAAEYLRALVYDSTDTLLFDYNPNSYNRAVNATQWTSVTGETYTINVNSGATGLKAMMVDQTMAQGNGTSMGMQAASASLNSLVFTQYIVWRKFSNATTAGSNGSLIEYGPSVSSGQGMAFAPNENASTESLYTNSNIGLSGTSWQSNSLLLKLSTFKGNINGSPYEQGLDTNDVANNFNAVQAAGDNTTAILATGKNLGARNNAASLWLNFIWVGELMTTQTDTSGQEAAIYNMFADGTNII